MLATLPMYDWPEVRPATDRLWALIRDGLRAHGLEAPDALHRGPRWNDWLAPDLMMSQTCGFPYRTMLHGKVELVGTPDYGLPDAPAGHYYSQLLTRKGDNPDWQTYPGRTLAINGHDSQSGWAAPQNHAATIGKRFGAILVTGAHAASAEAVAEGRADMAAIDAVTWRLMQAHRPGMAARLTVIARTAPTPGLPLITARGRDAPLIARVVRAAILELPDADRNSLGLKGLAAIPASEYLAVPTPAAEPTGPDILDE